MRTYEFRVAGKTTVVLDNNFLRVNRRGGMSFFSHGLVGEKTIDINNISGVQLKKPGVLTNGYIQFLIIGSQENKQGIFGAAQDENTIMFGKAGLPMAEEIKRLIETAIINKNNGVDNTQPPVLDDSIMVEKGITGGARCGGCCMIYLLAFILIVVAIVLFILI